MAYEPMTVEKMLAKIKAGDYETAGAARRGIGKLKDVNNAGKEKIYAAVAAHFGAEADTKVAAKATKAPKTPKAPKTAKQTSSKQVAKKSGRTVVGAGLPAPTGSDATIEMLAQIHLAKERVGTIAQAIAAMKAAKDINSTIDLGNGPQIAASAISTILNDVRTTVGSAFATDPSEVPEESPADGVPEPAVFNN